MPDPTRWNAAAHPWPLPSRFAHWGSALVVAGALSLAFVHDLPDSSDLSRSLSSDALRNSGIAWDAAALQKYLADPRAMVPGGKMKYDGLASAADREALVVWLARQGR